MLLTEENLYYGDSRGVSFHLHWIFFLCLIESSFWNNVKWLLLTLHLIIKFEVDIILFCCWGNFYLFQCCESKFQNKERRSRNLFLKCYTGFRMQFRKKAFKILTLLNPLIKFVTLLKAIQKYLSRLYSGEHISRKGWICIVKEYVV